MTTTTNQTQATSEAFKAPSSYNPWDFSSPLTAPLGVLIHSFLEVTTLFTKNGQLWRELRREASQTQTKESCQTSKLQIKEGADRKAVYFFEGAKELTGALTKLGWTAGGMAYQNHLMNEPEMVNARSYESALNGETTPDAVLGEELGLDGLFDRQDPATQERITQMKDGINFGEGSPAEKETVLSDGDTVTDQDIIERMLSPDEKASLEKQTTKRIDRLQQQIQTKVQTWNNLAQVVGAIPSGALAFGSGVYTEYASKDQAGATMMQTLASQNGEIASQDDQMAGQSNDFKELIYKIIDELSNENNFK